MKKLAIVLLGILVLGTSSCRKVTEEYYTIPNKTIYDVVQENEWITNDGGVTYSFSIPLAEINQNVYDLDGILVYGTFVDGEDEPIPNVFEGISYTYAVRVGAIIIKVQSTDLGEINRPGALPVKIVLIPSER